MSQPLTHIPPELEPRSLGSPWHIGKGRRCADSCPSIHLYLHSLVCACLSGLPANSQPHFPYPPSQSRPPYGNLHTLFLHHGIPGSRKCHIRTPPLCPDVLFQAHKESHCMHLTSLLLLRKILFSSFLVSDSKTK